MNGCAHLPPPSAYESLDSVLARCGGARDERGIAGLPGGRVYGSGIVLSPDGSSVIRELTHDFGSEGTGRHWLQDHKKIRPPAHVGGRTAVVAVNLGAGYAHWLLEELPRWLALRNEDADQVIAHDRAPYIREVITALGRPWRVLPATRHGHFECETLVAPPLAPTDSRLVETINAFARDQPLPATAFGDKLYITREKAARRRVLNEHALWPVLEAQGFVRLRLEELAWREQVAAFLAAKIVVAPHGAGLANLVFCQAGTRVVEFFNNAYVNPCFGRLAAAAGLDYHAVLAVENAPASTDPTAGRLDIRADIPQIVHALKSDD